MASPTAYNTATVYPALGSGEWRAYNPEEVFEHHLGPLKGLPLLHVAQVFTLDELKSHEHAVTGKDVKHSMIHMRITRALKAVCAEQKVDFESTKEAFFKNRDNNIKMRGGRSWGRRRVTKEGDDPDAFKGLTLAELKAVKKGNVDKSAYSIALLAAIRAECGEGAEGTQAFVVKWDATLHSARQKIGETRNAAANAQNVKPSNFTLITKTYTHADEAKPVTEAVARLAAAPNTPVTATAPSASSDDGERDEDKDADGADEEVEIDILSEAGDVPMPPSRRPESSVVGEASLGSSEAVNERAAVEPQSPSGGYAFKTYNATGNGYGPLPAVAETAQAVSTTDPLSAPTFTAINALPSPQDRTVAAGTTPPRSGDLARATKKQKTSHDPSHESHRPKTLLYGKPEQRRAFFALEAIRELLDPSRPVVLTSPEILFTTFHPVQWKFEGLAETPASSANFRTFCASAYAARLFRSCNGGKGIDEYVRWVIKEYMISGCTTGASFLKFLTFRMAHAGGFRVCEAVARKVYERQVEIELEIELEMERELEEEFVEEFGEDPEEESGEEFGA